MGIYISGVKGLPEQVQKNKEDIKTIQDEIEGIDFDTIRELEEQVGENTQDINNLENAIGVQNQAINSLNDDVDALETKTQLMSYNDDLSQTEFRNSIEVADDVVASGVHVNGDGVMVNSMGSGLHFQEGGNDDEVNLVNNESGTAHILTLHADGSLTLDGQAVGGSNPLYQHNIRIYNLVSGNNLIDVHFKIIDTNSNSYATYNDIKTFLTTNGYTTSNKSLMASGVYIDLSANTDSGNIISINLDTPSVVVSRYSPTANNVIYHIVPSASTINDFVVQIA